MDKIKSLFKKAKEKLFLALKRYPIALVLLLAAAVMVMITIDINSNNKNIDDEIFIRLAMSLLYGAILSLVIKSVAERFDFSKIIEWLTYILVPAAMALVYLLLIPNFDSMEIMLKYALLCVLSAALFFFVPFVRSEESAPFFAQKVFLRLAVTMIYYGIIVGGVEAIIFAIENLLSVNMPNEIYGQTAVALAGLFIPSFFFAGIPKKGDEQDSYPKLLKILLHYIVYILLAAYTFVLYAYFIKILFEFTLPSNLLGNLVIYYSLISIAALYFGHFTKDENKWTRIFYTAFPFVLILPTLMMLLSFIVRINQYGFTEPRYYAILCVIFVLRAISIIKLQKKVKLIPLVLSVLLLVSIFGPLSSFNVSKWSQNRRFEKILTQEGMLKDGEIIPNPDASDEGKHEISQIVSYFDSNHSAADLKYIDADFDSSEMKTYFGFERFYLNKAEENFFINTVYERYQILDVEGYSYIADLFPYYEDADFDMKGKTITITTQNEDKYVMSISVDGEEIYSTSILDMVMPYFTAATTEDESNEYIFTQETDSIKVKMIIMNAQYSKGNDGYLYYDIKLLFSIK